LERNFFSPSFKKWMRRFHDLLREKYYVDICWLETGRKQNLPPEYQIKYQYIDDPKVMIPPTDVLLCTGWHTE
jgi:hypothetical protein